jgi:hypothetical protein
MVQLAQYGTIPLTEPASSSGSSSASSSANSELLSGKMEGSEKKEQQHEADYARDVDERSLSSEDSAQAGVKRIEAISTTWTKWSLGTAYLG